jgi:large subunit ribosomal protein L17
MEHQIKNKKMNLSWKHRKAFLRNSAMHFILFGKLKSTLLTVKEVRRFVEKIVTIAKQGKSQHTIRKVRAIIPCGNGKEAFEKYQKNIINKLFLSIAPQYETREGGYTRIYNLGTRLQDTAKVGLLTWV